MTGTFALLLALSLSGARAPRVSVDTAVFAGGCFWGIEGVFEHTKGVISATAGYAGGHTVSPSYEDVSSGETGHAEAVRVVYDPSQVTYAQLLNVFFTVAHDPTELDRQGPDVGTNYRSVAFYRDSTQHAAIAAYLADLERRHVYRQPVVTQVVPLTAFYEAEGYNQHYMEHHPDQPYIVYNDAPKVVALRKTFPGLYRDSWK
jgi:peptide-methionine (S)-S-oxide reductase